MTREDAISLVQQYATVLKDKQEYYGVDVQDRLQSLSSRIDNPDHSEAKCMRWLGFIQGMLFSEYIYTVDELKEHSKNRTVTPPEFEDF